MSNTLSLIFYMCIFSTSAIFYALGLKYKSKFCSAISVLILSVISGIRYMVGADYWLYLELYKTWKTYDTFDFIRDSGIRELFYYMVNRLSYLIFNSYVVMFFACSFLTVYFFYKGLRKLDVKYKSILYFMYLVIFFPPSFNIIRQCIAVSICVYAFNYLKKENLKKYILYIFLAFLFHSSSIIMLPMYFLRRFFLKENIWNIVITFGICMLALPFMFVVTEMIPFFNKYSMYVEFDGVINNYTFYLNVCIYCAILCFHKPLMKKEENRIWLHYLTISIVGGFMGFMSPFIARIATYFSISQIILLANLVEIFKTRESKLIACAGLLVYAVLFFVISFYILGQASVIPYRTIFGI